MSTLGREFAAFLHSFSRQRLLMLPGVAGELWHQVCPACPHQEHAKSAGAGQSGLHRLHWAGSQPPDTSGLQANWTSLWAGRREAPWTPGEEGIETGQLAEKGREGPCRIGSGPPLGAMCPQPGLTGATLRRQCALQSPRNREAAFPPLQAPSNRAGLVPSLQAAQQRGDSFLPCSRPATGRSLSFPAIA